MGRLSDERSVSVSLMFMFYLFSDVDIYLQEMNDVRYGMP